MKSQRSKTLLVALIICTIFYWFVNQPYMKHSVLHTYTTEHATEYAIVGLFCWANTDLVYCALRSRREARANRYFWLPTREGVESVANAESVYLYALAGPAELRDSMMFRRIDAALRYVRERQSAVGFREYLECLSERDAEATFSRYGFPRFAAGLLPILGLLGTVVHFGGALSGLSSDDLVTKVPQIVSGMGTAFNTTCAALTASCSTLLFRFLIESHEETLVAQVNKYVEDQLLHRFVAEEQENAALTKLEQTLERLVVAMENTQDSDAGPKNVAA